MKVAATKPKNTLKISDILFEKILKVLECDTLNDECCVAFSGFYTVEEHIDQSKFRVEFFGCDGFDYKLMIPQHNNYVNIIPFIGSPAKMFIAFTKAQKRRMQALINKKVVEVKQENERAKSEWYTKPVGFNPYTVYGHKESDFLNAI